jgi:hypothetical protein
MSCSSGGSACSSAPAAASSAAYRKPGEEHTYKYTGGEIAWVLLVATVPFLLMIAMGIVAGLAIYINDLVSVPQSAPTPQSSSQTLIDASQNSSQTTRDEP